MLLLSRYAMAPREYDRCCMFFSIRNFTGLNQTMIVDAIGGGVSGVREGWDRLDQSTLNTR
jgi:hypothetical protein